MIRKVSQNKKNGQLVVTIPKKAYPFLKDKPPKSVRLTLKKEDFEF